MFYNKEYDSTLSHDQLLNLGIDYANKELIQSMGYVEVKNTSPDFDSYLYLIYDKGLNKDTATIEYEVIPRDLSIVKNILKSRVKSRRDIVINKAIKVPDTDIYISPIGENFNKLYVLYKGFSILDKSVLVDFNMGQEWCSFSFNILEELFTSYYSKLNACYAREKEINTLLDKCDTVVDSEKVFNTEIEIGWPEYA